VVQESAPGCDAKPVRKLAILGALLALVLAASAYAAGVWTSEARTLASDDHSGNVAPYERGLNVARWKCRESRHRVAALVWSTKRVLRGDGYRYSNLSILRGLNRSIPASLAPTRCSDMLAALVVLIERG
jgi:hypothetical protein